MRHVTFLVANRIPPARMRKAAIFSRFQIRDGRLRALQKQVRISQRFFDSLHAAQKILDSGLQRPIPLRNPLLFSLQWVGTEWTQAAQA